MFMQAKRPLAAESFYSFGVRRAASIPHKFSLIWNPPMLNFTGVPTELQAPAQRLWESFESSLREHNLVLPLAGLAISHDEFSRQLTRAFTGSEFIAKTAARRPQFLLELMESGALFRVQTDADIDAFAALIRASTSDAELDSRLRNERNKAM